MLTPLDATFIHRERRAANDLSNFRRNAEGGAKSIVFAQHADLDRDAKQLSRCIDEMKPQSACDLQFVTFDAPPMPLVVKSIDG